MIGIGMRDDDRIHMRDAARPEHRRNGTYARQRRTQPARIVEQISTIRQLDQYAHAVTHCYKVASQRTGLLPRQHRASLA